MLRTVITGTGSYIPEAIVSNDDFIKNKFYSEDGNIIESPSHEIIKKFEDITGISERRYVSEELMASDLGYIAAKKAIEDANIDPETLDQIIVAHNYGDVAYNSVQTDAVPALASRIKQKLGIINPSFGNTVSGISFCISSLRASSIPANSVVAIIIIVDDNCISETIIPVLRNTVTVYITITNVSAWYKIPAIIRNRAKRNIDVDAVTKWCPAIIIIVTAPAYPGRCPFVTRYPHPSLVRIQFPSAIMKWRPAPVVIGFPAPAIVGVLPMAIGIIGFKVCIITYPDLPKPGIVHPPAIRAKFLLKSIEVNRYRY